MAGAGVAAGGLAAAALVWGGYQTTQPVLAVAVVLSLAVGWSFIFVGLAAASTRPDSQIGALMIGTGFAALARDVGAIDSHLGFALGRGVEDIAICMVGHLLISFPSGRLQGRTQKAFVGFIYFLSAPLDLIIYYLLSDQAACYACRRNLGIVHYATGSPTPVDWLLMPTVALVCAVVLWMMFRRWRRASPPLRRSLGPALAGGGLFISAIAAQRIGVLLAPPTPVRVVLAWSSEVALVCFPIGLLVGLIRSRLDRSAVADLTVALTGSPGPDLLRSALASAVHDPSLQVGYWLPEQRQYVDGSGLPVTSVERSGRTTTVLERDGRPVAALFYDTVVAEEGSLIRAVAAAAGLAIENERLHAEARAQLIEVRASRARIVEASLTERRRVERDLHDGAQQRLLGVLLGLRLVRSQLDSGDYTAAGTTVDDARHELSTGLQEIRELAHGIHPAVLTDAGLPAALRSLAERAAVPVTITAVPTQRLPSAVEQTAYYVVAESVVNTVKHAHAAAVSVCIRLDAGRLRVEIRDDGVGGAQPSQGSGLRGLSDRVAALDGNLSVRSTPGGGTTVIAELPCV